MSTEWSVYMIKCRGSRREISYYTGISNDVPRRIRRHAAGSGARYTRTRRLLSYVVVFTRLSQGEAMRREREVKRYTPHTKAVLFGSLVERLVPRG